MAFISTERASLGNAVLIGTPLTSTTSQHFVYQQIDSYLGQINAVASQQTVLSLRVVPIGDAARRKYDYPQTPGDYRTYAVAWAGTQAATAAALVAAANLGEDKITLTSTSGGGFRIETKDGSTPKYGLLIEFGQLHLITVSRITVGLDLTTWSGNAIIFGSVTGGNVNLKQTGGAVIAEEGIEIVAGNPFDIIGVTNIINAQVIETDSGDPATVNYELYMG